DGVHSQSCATFCVICLATVLGEVDAGPLVFRLGANADELVAQLERRVRRGETIDDQREEAADLDPQRRDAGAALPLPAGVDPIRWQDSPPEELPVETGEETADDAGREVTGDGPDRVVDAQLPLDPPERVRELEAGDEAD